MSKLTEEIKKLSRKLDDIDRRVELIEDKQPKITVKVEEPKFKIGDWVRSLITGTAGKVEAFYEEGSHSTYLLSTIDGEKFTSKANNLESYFLKKGEYVFAKPKTSYECIFIYSHTGEYNGEISIFDKASLIPDFKICLVNTNPLAQVKGLENIRPATSEEKALLDSELTKRGLIFDGKEIVKDNTPKVGDFCIFWGEIPEKAFCDILYEIHNSIYPFRRDNIWYKNCIKYESIEQFRKIKEGKI